MQWWLRAALPYHSASLCCELAESAGYMQCIVLLRETGGVAVGNDAV
jgi:hypothetical protein